MNDVKRLAINEWTAWDIAENNCFISKRDESGTVYIKDKEELEDLKELIERIEKIAFKSAKETLK